MGRNYLKAIFLIIISVLLFSCAVKKPMIIPKGINLNPKLQSGQYVPKVDNFLVVLDRSGSMQDPYKGQSKLDLAKNIVGLMNHTIPDLKLMGALRIFGRAGGIFSTAQTARIYGLTGYSTAGLDEALKTVTWGIGDSPLGLATEAAGNDLKTAQGKIALIIVSDGVDMDKSPLLAAKNIKGQFGDRLCIYTILVGNDAAGKKLLEQIAQAGQCGFSVSADQIVSQEGMAGFVQKVFLAKRLDSDGDGVYDDQDRCPHTPSGVKVDSVGCPLDTDGDGVPDYKDKCPDTAKGLKVNDIGCPFDSDGDGVLDDKDQCPDTPKGAPVDTRGCPLDTDGDGVYDYLDRCPNTPKGARVNEMGCWVLAGVFFDTDKWNIKPVSYPVLEDAANVLKSNPHLKVELQGHADSTGNSKYNQRLSENRAKAVMDHLVQKGIAIERLSTIGYASTRPLASNLTVEGRAKNRRVELTPIP